MKKCGILYEEDEKGVLIVRAFMLIKESNFNSADKWWILNEYHRWLEAQQKLNQLYSDKPTNWISDSHQWSQIKVNSMCAIVRFFRDHYAMQRNSDNPTTGSYRCLDKLFGKDNWNESGLQ